jgi:hypothetical protein
MLRETFIWLLEHVHERVRLVFENSLGGQVKRQVRAFDFISCQVSETLV